MKSPLVRLLGPGTVLVVMGLTGPVLSQEFTLRGTLQNLSPQATACLDSRVAQLCGFETADVRGNVGGSPPSNNSFQEYPAGDLSGGDCQFTAELFNNSNKSVDFVDLSTASQICGTPGAEAALVRNKNDWNVYCGNNVVEQTSLLPPAGSGNVSAEQVAICYTGGLCGASSEQAVADACAALGNPDYVTADDIVGGGDFNVCACPGTEATSCAPDDPTCLFDSTTPNYLESTFGLQQGLGSCKTLCKSTTGGTGSAFTSCVALCQSAQ